VLTVAAIIEHLDQFARGVWLATGTTSAFCWANAALWCSGS